MRSLRGHKTAGAAALKTCFPCWPFPHSVSHSSNFLLSGLSPFRFACVASFATRMETKKEAPAGLTIYGRLNSVNVQKVVWAAHELGTDFKRIDAGGVYDLNKSNPKYLELNPNGLIPTIDDNGFVLFESNSIVRYLAERYADQGVSLRPSDLKERALAGQWMDWVFDLGTEMRTVFWGLVRTPEGQRDMKSIQEAAVRAAKVWEVLDKQLAKTPYVAGHHFSMGDIPVGCHAHRWFRMNEKFDLHQPELVHLRQWYNRLLEREGYKLYVALELS